MKIERYSAYSNSEIEWLGNIPKHWELSRIKQKGTVRGRVGWKALKADEYVDEGYIFLATPNIKEKEIDFENVNYITHERYIESPEIMIQKGDILLTKDGSTLGTTNIVVSLPRKATVNSSIAVVRFNKEVFKKYIYYQILSDFIQNKINLKKSGMGVPHLFQRDINNFFILVPSLPEQKEIAHYLDTKTAQIDRKIGLLTQKATRYGNLKQSLINETVTRGLDKSVTMKDSGLEWLGEIPKHWALSRIKQEGTVRGRVGWKALKADEYVDEGYIFLSTPNIKEKEIDFKNVNYITRDRYMESPEIMIQEGDILLTKDGSTLGTTNIVTSLPSEATVNSSIAVVRFGKGMFNKYIYYQILSENIQNKISLKKSGMGVPHLFQRDINNFFILLPPLSEQKTIADYLDIKTTQIDQIIQTLNTQIEKLKELRKTLINDVVTGKIRVIEEHPSSSNS
jgi:type I restriction enzyme, S subunit